MVRPTHTIIRCPTEAIRCKFCGSTDIVKYGKRHGIQNYLCRSCGRKFTDKDTLEGKQIPTAQVGAALSMFYDGLSLTGISRQLEGIFNNRVNPSTIYRWVIEYSEKAIELLSSYKAEVSEVWVVDETVVKIGRENLWYWDVIDDGTRYLINTHLSKTRRITDVVALFTECKNRVVSGPRVIMSDKMAAYIDGIERVFGAEAKHIQSKGMTSDTNINLIERFHSTLKQRTKVMRGLKTKSSAQAILDGFVVHYNFFRPHMSLGDSTPAEVAGIEVPFKTWEELLRSMQPRSVIVRKK